MNEVTNDLKLLAEMEIPPKSDRVGRNVVKLTVFCFSVLLLTCVGGLVFALKASTTREDNLNRSLQCVRESAYEYESAVGDAVKLLVDLNIPITEGLAAFGRDDMAGLQMALRHADESVAASSEIKAQVERAIQARQTALNEC